MVAAVLAPEPHGIAASQARVEEEVEGEALTATQRPLGLGAGKLVLRPSVKPGVVVLAGEQLDAERRIGRDELAVERPAC